MENFWQIITILQENQGRRIFKKDLFFKKKNRLFGKIATYDQNKRSSIQIDDFEDLKIMRKIIS